MRTQYSKEKPARMAIKSGQAPKRISKKKGAYDQKSYVLGTTYFLETDQVKPSKQSKSKKSKFT